MKFGFGIKKKEDSLKYSDIDFLVDFLAAWMSKGDLEQIPRIKSNSIVCGISKIYTSSGSGIKVHRFYVLDAVPMYVQRKFIERMQYLIMKYGKCNLFIISEKFVLDFRDYRTRTIIREWKARYESVLQKQQGQDIFDKLTEDEESRHAKQVITHMVKSYDYIMKMRENDRELGRFYIIIEAITSSVEDMNKLDIELRNDLMYKDIHFKVPFFYNKEFLSSFNPIAGFVNYSPALQFVRPFTSADITLAQLIPVEQGISLGKGIYMGTDVISNIPIFVDFKSRNEASNILITAETGGGKSSLFKTYLMYFLLDDYDVILLDYEGDEYQIYGRYLGANMISLSGVDSVYFDTCEIGDLTGDYEIDSSLKVMSESVTENVFDILCNINTGMTNIQKMFFNKALRDVQQELGITDDPSTWKNSKKMSYHQIYFKLKSYLTSNNDIEFIENRKELADMVASLSIYFEPDGTYSYLFSNRIGISDVIGSKFTIFNFSMKGKQDTSIDKRLIALKQLYISYLTALVMNYNKSVRNRHTVVVFEEVQRYIENLYSASILRNIITGARKRNAVVILITNAPMDLIVNKNEVTMSILENITSFVIGSLKKKSVDLLIDTLGFDDVKSLLYELSDTNSNRKYQFLLNINRGNWFLIKSIIPKLLLETPLFKTRDVINSDENKEF